MVGVDAGAPPGTDGFLTVAVPTAFVATGSSATVAADLPPAGRFAAAGDFVGRAAAALDAGAADLMAGDLLAPDRAAVRFVALRFPADRLPADRFPMDPVAVDRLAGDSDDADADAAAADLDAAVDAVAPGASTGTRATISAIASWRYSIRFHTSGTISRHAISPKSREPS